MSNKSFKSVKFSPNDKKAFGITLRKRVAEYFKSNNISRNGDYRAWIKVITLPILYLLPFVFIITNSYSGSLFIFYSLWILMGIGLAGCGLSVMHDACHGSLSKSKRVNDFVGSSILNLVSGSAINWKIQHNVLHHSFTNIEGYDEDVSPSGVMRFTPDQPLKPIFKYQAYYAWFFYGLMTFLWATIKDFAQLFRYKKMGLIEAQGKKFKKELILLIIRKIVYYAIFMVLPIVLLETPWYHVLGAWFCMHFLAGTILAVIFQSAHIVPEAQFPIPDESNQVEGDFAYHQLMTTANFAPNNKLFSWYAGGLNFQIEHHLFPNVNHIHLKDLSKIVKETAEEFDLPYHTSPTVLSAVVNHAKFLNRLGNVA